MDDLKAEKNKLKLNVIKSEANLQRDWVRLRSSVTFSNLTELAGEQLFPGTFTRVKSRVSQFTGLWNALISGLLDRLFDRFGPKKD